MNHHGESDEEVPVARPAVRRGLADRLRQLQRQPAHRPGGRRGENRPQGRVAVGEPISGDSSVNILFGFLKFGGDSQFADGVTYGAESGSGLSLGAFDPVSSAKAAAAFKAVKNSNADLIVAPRYEVSVNDYFLFKKVDVKVTGSKGTIRSIR